MLFLIVIYCFNKFKFNVTYSSLKYKCANVANIKLYGIVIILWTNAR